MAKVCIYWTTPSREAKRRIMERFGIRGESVNGESEAVITDAAELELFKECERRGFFKIRKKA